MAGTFVLSSDLRTRDLPSNGSAVFNNVDLHLWINAVLGNELNLALGA